MQWCWSRWGRRVGSWGLGVGRGLLGLRGDAPWWGQGPGAGPAPGSSQADRLRVLSPESGRGAARLGDRGAQHDALRWPAPGPPSCGWSPTSSCLGPGGHALR